MGTEVDYTTSIDMFGDTRITRRLMAPSDEASVLAFTRALPPHDLLFVRRDVTNPKVVSAWMQGMREGQNVAVVATNDAEEIVGCAALFRDTLSWSPHVGDIRVLIAPGLRGKGLGRAMIQDCFKLALQQGISLLSAQMTVDQKAAVTIFEELGFSGSALLADHVMDRDGKKHDIVVLTCDVDQFSARANMYAEPA